MKQLDLFAAPAPGEAEERVWPEGPRGVLVAAGSRAAEDALLARLDALVAEARRDPGLLALPVRVVVPSRSLRRHVAARLVGQAGGRPAALLGVAVQTLYGVACEALERTGEPAPRGALLFETLVAREARREPRLRDALGGLEDGFLGVAAAAGELLDAGFEPAHAAALDEALAADGRWVASPAAVARARAVARVAARTEERLGELGLGRRSTVLRRAAAALAASPDRALPARAVLLHGFTAASGAAGDLLLALLRRPGALLVLDQPPVPGPAAAAGAPAGAARLRELAAGVAAPRRWPGAPAAARLTAHVAVGVEAEVRQVAARLRLLLDGADGGGAAPAPERLAVVARDLAAREGGAYRAALRRHLRLLGVPFSGVGARGGTLPAGRRAAAVLDLLRRGGQATADRWLDACAAIPAAEQVDLRLALHALGAARLRDVAELRGPALASGLALPIRDGSAPLAPSDLPGAAGEPSHGGGDASAVARRRRIPAARLRVAIELARRVQHRLVQQPAAAAARDQLAWLRGLLNDLGEPAEPAPAGSHGGNAHAIPAAPPAEPAGHAAAPASPLLAAVAEIERAVPGELPLTPEEVRLLLGRALGGGGAAPIGGAGGGVQVLSLAEARGRTFEHLFVIGLNRDVFPRPLRDDPLLPDELRRVAQRVLPDLALRRDGRDEERHAFAQLLSAAPEVHLSWLAADDDGKALTASPLIDALAGLRRATAPSLRSPALAGPRTAQEHAVLAGLRGARDELELLLPAALREAREAETAGIEALAAARRRILDEMEPDRRTAAGRRAAARLGPYLGLAGPRELHAVPALWVTHLERLAACPWQLFLGRLLRVEPPPDPLALLAGDDPLLLGSVVHRALDRIVRRQLPRGGVGAAPVHWPAEEELAPVLLAAATEALAEEGVALPGLARALADRAAAYVEEAGRLDWPRPDSTVAVLGTEVEGELLLGERRLRLRFRADREDLAGGSRRFTDYKTGKPLSTGQDAARARARLLAEMRGGHRLQAAAYALAGGPATAVGRYLFLRPVSASSGSQELAVDAADREATDVFTASVGALVDCWEEGGFLPRVVDPAGREEPDACSFCTVAEACVRGDAGARRRLRDWAAAARAAAPGAPAAPSGARAAPPGEAAPDAAFLAVWDLPGGGLQAAAARLDVAETAVTGEAESAP